MFLGRVVGEGEPLFTEVDRLWALALHEEEAATHTCGQPIAESFDPASEEGYRARGLVCHACAERDREVAARQQQPGANPMAGYHVIVEKRDISD